MAAEEGHDDPPGAEATPGWATVEPSRMLCSVCYRYGREQVLAAPKKSYVVRAGPPFLLASADAEALADATDVRALAPEDIDPVKPYRQARIVCRKCDCILGTVLSVTRPFDLLNTPGEMPAPIGFIPTFRASAVIFAPEGLSLLAHTMGANEAKAYWGSKLPLREPQRFVWHLIPVDAEGMPTTEHGLVRSHDDALRAFWLMPRGLSVREERLALKRRPIEYWHYTQCTESPPEPRRYRLGQPLPAALALRAPVAVDPDVEFRRHAHGTAADDALLGPVLYRSLA